MRQLDYLLDTDVCVDCLRGRRAVRDSVAAHRTISAIASITLAELMFGAVRSHESEENREAVGELLRSLAVLPLQWEVALRFAHIKLDLQHKGLPLPDFDLLIAATALAHGLVLVTGNTSHFERIPELKLENWREANG